MGRMINSLKRLAAQGKMSPGLRVSTQGGEKLGRLLPMTPRLGIRTG